LIEAEPNMRAVLTRNGDYFVPLIDRIKLARKGKADLFIAIHADSYFNTSSSGASVYALSRGGATSVAAKWLAQRDNYSELGGVDLGELEDQSYLLRSVLIDLAQTATITDSMRLGKSVLHSLDDVTRLHYSRVEQAPFMVLKSPDIPSILVETGFISNAKEEMHLRDPRYQDQIAQALLNGVRTYFRKYSSG
jgi:N-acetylmuramoyl-L-alanine amidase